MQVDKTKANGQRHRLAQVGTGSAQDQAGAQRAEQKAVAPVEQVGTGNSILLHTRENNSLSHIGRNGVEHVPTCAKTRFTLTLEPLSAGEADTAIRVRKLLKALCRRHGLKCVSIMDHNPQHQHPAEAAKE
jgi:hypothetical protein